MDIKKYINSFLIDPHKIKYGYGIQNIYLSDINLDKFPKLKEKVNGKDYDFKIMSFYDDVTLLLYQPMLSHTGIITSMFRVKRKNIPIGLDRYDCYKDYKNYRTDRVYYEMKQEIQDFMENKLISFIENAESTFDSYKDEYNMRTELINIYNEIKEKQKSYKSLKNKITTVLKRNFKMKNDFK
mgnify:CR=1 FL=1